ncbi:ATP-dependent Clp protease ATP-binding subunit [Patescibacteria group bacterium]|nr:MAG: ATP-dependent Clp protease ATP-binding subunit [Patescibacteria group bacterium]
MATTQIFIVLVLALAGLLYWWYNSRQRAGGGFKGTVLQTYTRDLTKEAEAKALDPVIGRAEEIDRVIHILSRRTKNNPLLLGEPGVGKTAVVEGIARRIAAGDVPDNLRDKRVLALDLGGLISGTKYRGEFEERMKKLTDEIKGTARRIILFIDEVHMIEQAKGAEGAMNVSDILKPALSRGELQAIGATTWKEYEHLIKPDDALNRRFQPVIVGEPSEEATLQILRGIKEVYEAHHGVVFDDAALLAAVKLSKKFIKDRYLPDKAIDLMDEAGAKVSIEAAHNAKHAMGLLHAAGAAVATRGQTLSEEEKRLRDELEHLKALESELTEEAELTEIRSRLEHLVGAMEKLRRKELTAARPTVSAADIREIVAEWIGKKPIDLEGL